MTLPGQIRPMEPTSASSPFDDPEFLYQVKWDGVRMIAFVMGSDIRLQNRQLHDRTLIYPEVVAALRDLDLVDTVLDGEIVVVDEQGARFDLVMKRDGAGLRRVSTVQREYPVQFIVFDLLYERGRPIMNRPLAERLQALRSRITVGDVVSVVEDHDEGTALFRAVVEKQWEGIVAKRRDSAYRVGVKTADWQKIKRKERQRLSVVGYVERRGQLSALVVGHVRGNEVEVVSRVGSGLSDQDRMLLHGYLEGRQLREETIKVRSGETGVMVVSDVTAEVEHQGITADGGLRAPVIKGLAVEKWDE